MMISVYILVVGIWYLSGYQTHLIIALMERKSIISHGYKMTRRGGDIYIPVPGSGYTRVQVFLLFFAFYQQYCQVL